MQKVFALIFSAFISYFPAYIIVYAITWIANIFKPAPEGVDMYREANVMALEAFPDKHMVSVIAIIVGVCIGTIFAIWWKPERLNDSPKTRYPFRTRKAYISDEEVETNPERRNESAKLNDSEDWFDHSLEEHDDEHGWCPECEEFEEDLDN